MQKHKSLHTIFYTLSYDAHSPINYKDIKYVDEDEDIRYFASLRLYLKRVK